jgi:hypothetical protein
MAVRRRGDREVPPSGGPGSIDLVYHRQFPVHTGCLQRRQASNSLTSLATDITQAGTGLTTAAAATAATATAADESAAAEALKAEAAVTEAATTIKTSSGITRAEAEARLVPGVTPTQTTLFGAEERDQQHRYSAAFILLAPIPASSSTTTPDTSAGSRQPPNPAALNGPGQNLAAVPDETAMMEAEAAAAEVAAAEAAAAEMAVTAEAATATIEAVDSKAVEAAWWSARWWARRRARLKAIGLKARGLELGQAQHYTATAKRIGLLQGHVLVQDLTNALNQLYWAQIMGRLGCGVDEVDNGRGAGGWRGDSSDGDGEYGQVRNGGQRCPIQSRDL